MDYKDLQPKEVFHWFKEISNIPRESGNEKEISNFLVDFAKKRNLEYWQDDFLNVYIKKEASKGFENYPEVLLQGHMDMVCVKENGSDHDFSKDPIELVIDGEWLRANKTTLGADDGIAVAYALAILDDEKISHGPISVLITTGEETSMVGVNNLDTKKLNDPKYLLNIDSEEEGILTIGCAGGMDIKYSFEKEYEKAHGEFISIELKNFQGGHSGMEIDKYKLNAIKGLVRIIDGLDSYRIGKISGGVKRNAIPSEAFAIVEVDDAKKAIKNLEIIKDEIIHEYKNSDPKGEIIIEECKFDGEVLTRDLSEKIVNATMIVADGPVKKYAGNLVTSSNLGLIEEDDKKISFVILARSEVTSAKRFRRDVIKKQVEMFGAKVETSNEYPGWEREDSELLEMMKNVWEKLNGEKPEVLTTHGGLECGLLKQNMNQTQMVSFGPEIEGAHSPEERVNIKSTENNYKFLIELLKELK
ncbi:aminoacyl-histidine dipeptidase [Anaerococcus sp. HMSC065G05]|uniref:beta-Ala-His dipeptidase n=1 Tax=Anaerococcus sp. HMSC065G05 TaxID=1739356 RepID=UPI0008A56DA4|nr:beta-Ala-His dipeptidase [Anaerococcus sp. HMSC065G05]OFJ66900.1 aminoacyl-histidine dipeptidase [Anaerococcus sp. HMSC065G05]